ncbi:hypothetical protein [Streptomyces chryseus]
MKYSCDKVPFPVGALEYVLRSGNEWSAPVTLPWKSITPPALASYRGKLYAAFVRAAPDDKAVMWTRLDNGVWRKPERIGGDNSYHAPALGVAHGKLYYAVTGMNNALYFRTFTETGGWSAPEKRHEAERPDKAPSMTPFREGMWMTYVKNDGIPYLNIHDGNRWHGSHQDNIWWITDDPVGMGTWGGYVWRVMRKADNTIYLSRHPEDGNWENLGQIPNWLTSHGMALAPHGQRLSLLLRGMDGYLRAASYSSLPIYYTPALWSAPERVGGDQPVKLMDEPAAASHNGKLYIMYRREV